MTSDEYWHGDVWMVEVFREADKLHQKRLNEQFWLQGMYFYDGLCCALKNAFSGKGSVAAKYPSEPYEIFRKEKTEEQEEAEAENERLKAMLYMNNMVRAGKGWGH